MTEKNTMDGLFEAWFDISNEMGKAWAEAASAGGEQVAKAYRKWTESTADMGRLMAGAMAGDPAAAKEIARSWERWSEEMSRNLSALPGADRAALRELQEAWNKGYDRMRGLMTEQAMAQMRMVSRMGLRSGTGSGDSIPSAPDIPGTGMAKAASDYWMGHYQEAMARTTRAMEDGGDAAQRGREVFDIWSGFYSGLLKEVMATSDYARAMGAMRDASMDAIKRSRDSTEASLRSMGVPTRSDMDEVHRALKELAMDVKDIRSGMRRLEGGAALTPGRPKASGRGGAKGRSKAHARRSAIAGASTSGARDRDATEEP